MADKIKGITLEIGGNTQGLSKALKQVNSETKSTQKELEKVERLLKLDPKNTELLAQKQELLSKQVGTTKDKLEALKQAKAKADQDMKNGTEINEKEYNQLQQEIVKTESDLKKLTKETKNFSVTGEKIKSAGNSMTELGKKGMGATTAIAGAGAALVGLAAKSALAADDINTLSKQTGLSVEAIQKFQYCSELIDVPIETFTGSLAKLTKQMGSGNKAFDTLGVSITDSSGHLRNNQDVFYDCIDALGQMSNETERDAISMQIFGKKAQDLNPLIEGGADALKKYGAEAEAAGLILDQETLDAANKFNDAMDLMKAKTQGQFMKIGAEIAEALTPMLESLSSKLEGVLNWLSGLSTGQKEFIVNIAAIIAIIPPLLIILGTIVSSVTTLTTAVGALNLAFLANPITWIILAVVALIAIIATLWNKCEWFRNGVTAIWEGLKTGFETAYNFIKTLFTETIPNIFNTCINFIKENWQSILLLITNPIAGALNLLYKFNPEFKAWVDNLVAGIKEKFNKMKEIGKYVLEGLWNGINDKVQWLKDKVSGVVNKIKSWFTGKEGFDEHSPSKWAKEVGDFLMEGLANGVTENMSAEEALKKKLSNIKEFINKNIDQINNDIQQKETKLAQTLSTGNLYDENTVTMGDATDTFYTLHDFSKDTKRNLDFGTMLKNIENRLYTFSEDTETNSAFMELVRAMGIDKGTKFGKAILGASDSDFGNYIEGWKYYNISANMVSKNTYNNEATRLKEEFLGEIESGLSEAEGSFAQSGVDSAVAFGTGFMEKIRVVMSEIQATIASYNDDFSLSGIGNGNVSNSSSTTNNNHTNNITINNGSNSSSAYAQRAQINSLFNKMKLQGVN